VGSLWRSVEAGTGDPGEVAETAGRMAVAVPAQAPVLQDDPEQFSGVDRTLTAAVARAFIDQTLAAARETMGADARLVSVVESLHAETVPMVSSLRQGSSVVGLMRESWENLLTDFVTGIDSADPGVWVHLRERLRTGNRQAPVPARSDAGELSGVADPGLLPDDPNDWPDPNDWLDLADWPDPNDWPDLDTLPAGDNRPERAGPDPLWLRRLTTPSSPSDSTGLGGLTPASAWGSRRRRSREEGHEPDPGGKRLARQRE
ncbi:MAG TPA: hypothetical protein VFP72_13955, partial [Kineosporiaceae bacterium]|nr:hypothetical protein [Kineosporiaceae bacterium]